MRTYDDTFSGQKIYPGKVCLCPIPSPPLSPALRRLYTLPRSSSGTSHLQGDGDREGTAADRMGVIQGKLYIRGDSKIFRFQNGKTESLFLQRKNPRRIAWTVLFRRQHKKGMKEVSST